MRGPPHEPSAHTHLVAAPAPGVGASAFGTAFLSCSRHCSAGRPARPPTARHNQSWVIGSGTCCAACCGPHSRLRARAKPSSFCCCVGWRPRARSCLSSHALHLSSCGGLILSWRLTQRMSSPWACCWGCWWSCCALARARRRCCRPLCQTRSASQARTPPLRTRRVRWMSPLPRVPLSMSIRGSAPFSLARFAPSQLPAPRSPSSTGTTATRAG